MLEAVSNAGQSADRIFTARSLSHGDLKWCKPGRTGKPWAW